VVGGNFHCYVGMYYMKCRLCDRLCDSIDYINLRLVFLQGSRGIEGKIGMPGEKGEQVGAFNY